MPLAPQPRRRTDAPRAVSPRGVGLSAQSQHLALACGRRRCVSTPHWRTPRHLSGALATLSQHMLALATYLGHANIYSTYWYLQATAELLDGIALLGEAFYEEATS